MAAYTTSTAPQVAGAATAPGVPGGIPAKVSLYVGDLDRDTTEKELYEEFSKAGPVVSIRLCRDNITRSSLGYAYVNYNSHESAQAALNTLNYHPIRGKPCRIMWSERNPSVRKAGTGNVFVKNLHPSIDSKTLAEVFASAGPVHSAKVVTDDKGASRGYGYVTFDNDASARNAIDSLHGMEFEGLVMDVRPFVPRAARNKEGEWTNCYVKNVPRQWSDDSLRDAFARFGDITSAVIMRNPTGESKGFGFVNFKTAEAAEKAVAAMNEKEVAEEGKDEEGGATTVSKKLFVGRHQKKSDRMRELLKTFKERQQDATKNCNLYVKNLSDEITDDDLRQKFAKFGNITSARIMRDASGASKGFGFVCFSSADEASKAMTELNKVFWNGRPLWVSLAQRKDERVEILQKFHEARAHQATPAVAFRGAHGPVPGGVPTLPGVPAGAVANAPYANILSNPQLLQMLLYQQILAQNAGGSGPVVMPQMAMPTAPVAGAPTGPVSAPVAAGPSAMQTAPRGVPSGGAIPTNPRTMAQVVQSTAGAGAPAPRGVPAGAAPRGAPVGARGVPAGAAPRGAPVGGVRTAAGPAFHGAAGPQPRVAMASNVVAGGVPLNQYAPRPVAAAPAPAQTRAPQGAASSATLLENLRRTTDASAQRTLLGEALFPLIMALEPARAPKITGMLLEMDFGELLHLIETPPALKARVDEAVAVLESRK